MTKGRPRKYKQLEIGDIFEDLKVVESLGRNDSKQIILLVECTICGRQKEMKENTIHRSSGTTHSACGQALKLIDKQFYSHWQNMRTRTTNPNYEHSNSYIGINSDEFSLFIDFYDAFYESYLIHKNIHGKENTTLDRIDPNNSYTSDNCRWATWEIQYQNVRRSMHKKAISPNGEIFYFRSTNAFAKDHDISASTIRDYMNPKSKLKSAKGWHFELI